MMALESFSVLIFALGFVTAAPSAHHDCTLDYTVELAKLGKELFERYAKATGITANETQYYTAEVPGLPNCTSSGCHRICKNLQFFEGVFQDFSSSLSDDIMNQDHKTTLVTIISKILETQHHDKPVARLPRLPRPPPDTFTRKIMFYNAFRKYKNCAEKANDQCHRKTTYLPRSTESNSTGSE